MNSRLKSSLRSDKLTGLPRNRLPKYHLLTSMDVLCYYRYKHEVLQRTVSESCRSVIEDIFNLRNPVACHHQETKNMTRKLKKLVLEWKTIQKHYGSTHVASVKKIKDFETKLNSIFNIKFSNWNSLDSRPRIEVRPATIEETPPVLSERLRQRPTSIQAVKVEDEWFDVREQDSGNEVDSDDPNFTIQESKKNLRRVNVINNSVAENLDREKVSNRGTVGIVGSVANALGVDLNHVNLSKSTTHRKRKDVC